MIEKRIPGNKTFLVDTMEAIIQVERERVCVCDRERQSVWVRVCEREAERERLRERSPGTKHSWSIPWKPSSRSREKINSTYSRAYGLFTSGSFKKSYL